MHYGLTIGINFTREMAESEVDSLVRDLNSFKKSARKAGKIRGMDNYVFHVYDETEYNEVSEKFGGGLRIYAETESRDTFPVDDVKLICDRYEVVMAQFIRKLLI